jgi:hypothetical protein
MARTHLAHFQLSIEDAGHEVLMKIDDNSVVIVGHLQKILGQHLRPHSMQSLNANIINIAYQIIKLLLN